MTVRILEGHVVDVLATLAPASINCIWTSIPYWGLRSYGTVPQVWGGVADCAHEWGAQQRNGKRGDLKPSSETSSVARIGVDDRQGTAVLDGGRFCARCSAWKGEHGLEPSLDLWLAHEVEIWRGLRRVLRDDGVAWLNCGDAYATAPAGKSAAAYKAEGTDDRTFRDKPFNTTTASGLKSKQRLMLPARIALALQADGWWLRDEIVWAKPNPMPSSVADRTTPAHEMLYLLTKSPRYHFDAKAIAEPAGWDPGNTKFPDGWDTGAGGHSSVHRAGREKGRRSSIVRAAETESGARPPHSPPHKGLSAFEAEHSRNYSTRNKRSVWTITTEPFPEAHFATAPTALVEPCILAGCPQGGGGPRPVRWCGDDRARCRSAGARRRADRVEPRVCRDRAQADQRGRAAVRTDGSG